jgi:hypothetical protein
MDKENRTKKIADLFSSKQCPKNIKERIKWLENNYPLKYAKIKELMQKVVEKKNFKKIFFLKWKIEWVKRSEKRKESIKIEKKMEVKRLRITSRRLTTEKKQNEEIKIKKSEKEIKEGIETLKTIKGRIEYLKENALDKFMKIKELMTKLITRKNLKNIYFKKWIEKIVIKKTEIEKKIIGKKTKIMINEKEKKEIETAMKNIRTIKGRIDYLKKNYNDKYMRIRELMQAIVTTKNLKKIYFQKWANKVFHDVQEVEIVKSGKIERVRLERKVKHNITDQEKEIPGQKETEEQEDEFLNQKQKLLEELKKGGNYLVKYNEQVYLNSSLSDKIINDNVPKDNYYVTNYINKIPVVISKKTLSEEIPKENNKYIILQKDDSVVNKSELIDSITNNWNNKSDKINVKVFNGESEKIEEIDPSTFEGIKTIPDEELSNKLDEIQLLNQKLKQDLDNKNIELLNIKTTDAESVFVPSDIVKLVEQRQDYPFKSNYELTVLPTKEGEMIHKIVPKNNLTKQTSESFICLTLTEGKSMIINKSSLIKNLDNPESTIKVTNYKGEEITLNKCDIVGIKQYKEKEFNLIPPQSSEVISDLNKQIKSSFILIGDTNGKSQLVRKEYKDLILNSGFSFDIFNIPNEKHEMIKVSKQSLINAGENKEFIFSGIKDESFYLDKEHFNEPYSHNELYEEKIGYSTQEKDKKVFVKCTEIVIKDLESVNNLPEQEKKSNNAEDKLKELQDQIKNDDRKVIQVDKVFIPKTMVKLVKEDTSFPERDSFKVRDYKGEVVPINKNDLDKNKDEYLVGIIEGDKNQKIIPQKDLAKQLNQENIKPTTQLSSTDLLTGKPFSYTYNKLSLVNYSPQQITLNLLQFYPKKIIRSSHSFTKSFYSYKIKYSLSFPQSSLSP